MTKAGTTTAAILVWVLTGCSDGVAVVHGAPTFPDEVTHTIIATDAPITALGATSGHIVVGTELGASMVVEVALEALAVVDETNARTDTGAVLAIARDDDGSLLVMGGEGLFLLHGDRLLPSPASDVVDGLSVSALSAQNGELWMATDEGPHRYGAGVLEQWDVDEAVARPNAIAARASTVLIAESEDLAELDPNDASHQMIPLDAGQVHDIAVTAEGTYFVATDEGIVVRHPDGRYERHTLSDGGSGTTVTALAVDGAAVVATTSLGVVRFDGQDAVGLAPLVGAVPSAVAVDAYGHVWTGHDHDLVAHYVGAPSSYGSDVAPILVDRCASCHDEGGSGPPIDFADPQAAIDRADTIIDRVLAGTMPPAGAIALTGEELSAIVRWYETGQNP
ncbi:MAG TPA: hypothetical protein ENK57_22355 [Polyangiaceae bacterium]|nr:hypothetical protein [Polyangiaceae bacterium]